jgi:hypothetical protein
MEQEDLELEELVQTNGQLHDQIDELKKKVKETVSLAEF